ncbi:MAG: O-antigen ligase family protein [Candidatus Gracilibacteria bacterium]|jgi:O-antigen ligase
MEKTFSLKQFNKIFLFLNLFLLQAYLIRFKIFSYPSNVQEILIFVQILLFAWLVIKEKRMSETFKNLKKYWVVIGFFGLAMLSILIVKIPNQLDLIRYLKFLFFGGALAIMFLETLRTDEEKRKGIYMLGAGAVMFGIFSVFYNLAGGNHQNDLRLAGPLDAAVYLGFYLAPFLLFFTIDFFENKKKPSLLLAILLGILIIATRSMGSVLGIFLTLSLYIFIKQKNKILKTFKAKLILTILALIIFSAVFYTKILPTINTNYSSLDERGEIYQTSIYLLKENPKNWLTGLGFGQFQYYFEHTADLALSRPPLDYYVLQPHNIFLLFIFNFGLLGLIFLLTIIYKILKNLINVNSLPFFQLSAIFISVYFLIHGIIDTPFFKNDMLFLVMLFWQIGTLKPINK